MPVNGKPRKDAPVRLCDSPDFKTLILNTARQILPTKRTLDEFASIVEKDYYVTEALRLIAAGFNDRVIFKGGTSLSKGWNLIQRFSEDIDLFLDQRHYPTPLGKRKRDSEMKRIRDAVAAFPKFTVQEEETFSRIGLRRSDCFTYPAEFSGIANTVFVETSAAGGHQPTERRTMQSLVSAYLQKENLSIGAEDEAGFEMTLLHFRRTFVEKLFAIHSKIEILKRDGGILQSYPRHYYDLHQLSLQPEVAQMLQTEEYSEIKQDYHRITSAAYPDHYFHPPERKFALSDSLFPASDLRDMIAAAYMEQCDNLCFGSYPTWEEVELRFLELRDLL
jgi:hypothetical protein